MSTTNLSQSRLASIGESLFMLLVLALMLAVVAGYHPGGDDFPRDTSVAAAAELGNVDRLRTAPLDVLDAPDSTGTRPLTIAARFGRLEAVEVLLARGVDVNACGGGIGTALMVAAENGHADVVRALLSHGASVTKPAPYRHDALYCAVLGGSIDCVAALLDAGADPCDPRRKSSVLSAVAATGDRVDLVRLLVAAGADPNAVGRDQLPPLLSLGGDGEADGCVRALLELGADPNVEDLEGHTLRDIATVRHDSAILGMLD